MVHDRGIRRVDGRRRATSRRCSSSTPGSRSSIRRSTCGSRTTSPTRSWRSPSPTRRRACIVTRNRRIPGARYFGPYPKVWAVHDTIDLMIKVVPDPHLHRRDYKRAMATGRPCFPGQIGRCGGPCSMKVTIEEHRAIVDDFVAFMAGDDQRFIERAHRADAGGRRRAWTTRPPRGYRDQLAGDRRACSSKSARRARADSVDADLFGIAHDELAAAVQQFVIRGGRVRGVRALDGRQGARHPAAASSSTQVLQSAYGDAAPPTSRARSSCPRCPTTPPTLEEWLARAPRGRRVSIQVAQRGDKAELLKTATLNAQQALMLYKTRRTSDYVARTQALDRHPGGARAWPRRRCASSATTSRTSSGTNIVASMVVFEDGLPRKDQYRRFGDPETTDDTESIYQVLTRRLAYLDRATEDAGRAAAPSADRTDGEVVTTRKRPRFAYRAAAARRRRRQAAGRGGGARARRCRARGDRAVRHREAARGDLAAGRGLPGDPAAQQRGAVPAPAHPRRGAPVRDHPPARSGASATSRRVLAEIPGLGRRARQGAAAALRLGRPRSSGATPAEIAEVHGRRPDARRRDSRAPARNG